ncbi:MAG: AAA family ATPase [Chloroflexota bacterium]|nr:AAA family ATPase [Chloroflexota bacterium]MDE2908440.1 AAA family ATPase [Chloroflexota bacterium]
MKLKKNPFRPDKPVLTFEQFAGRSNELRVLVDSLYQIGHGNPMYKIVTGPRGIGKSSFVNQIQSLTTNHADILNELNVDAGDFAFRFAVYKHIAAKGQTTERIVLSLIRSMKNSISKDGALKIIDEFLENWKPTFGLPGGVAKLEYTGHSNSELSTDFIEALNEVWTELRADKDGIILVIDEVDTVAEDTDIASFLKVTTEQLAQSGLQQVALYPVGITDAIEKLKSEHGSIGRVFETIELMPMPPDECREVINKTLQSEEGSRYVEITESALDQVVQISEGFPAIIHQLCYHAFRFDVDDSLDDADLTKAIRHVVTKVRRQELDRSLQAAGSGVNRQIVQAMAMHDELHVPLKDIATTIGKTSSQMSSHMKALQNRGAIDKIDRALYKIADPLLRLYIRQMEEFGRPGFWGDGRQLRLPFSQEEGA